jgi:hypothetical protein
VTADASAWCQPDRVPTSPFISWLTDTVFPSTSHGYDERSRTTSAEIVRLCEFSLPHLFG